MCYLFAAVIISATEIAICSSQVDVYRLSILYSQRKFYDDYAVVPFKA